MRLQHSSHNIRSGLAHQRPSPAGIPTLKKKGGEKVELLKRLIVEEEGQGLVEYALIVLLVVFVFWVTIKNTNIGNQLSASWSNIGSCLANPTGCTAS
jgi:Flp pilus assembly pilin Flp